MTNRNDRAALARARVTADGLATAALAGPWTVPELARRMRDALGLRRTPPWLTAAAGELVATYRDAPSDRPRELAAFVEALEPWRPKQGRRRPPPVRVWTPAPTAMGPRRWPVADLPDLTALCRLLDVDAGELAWFADVHGRERAAAEALRHYRWTSLPKRGGGVRLVAAPKPRLKEIQRRLLRHVLGLIPVHDAAHGGVPGRSVRTATEPHSGATVVVRADLTSFFASVPAARVWGVLRGAGLPEAVAYEVTGLLTTVAPLAVSRDPALRMPHLPQGAPTSPRAADLVAFALDRRLAGLAARFGARYTRYVDDLTFSGGPSLRKARARVVALVDEIVRDEGFALNDRKTVVLGDSGRQAVLGAVVNAHPAVPRPERDALRALVHNCVVRGWSSQAGGRTRDEFRDHVMGRIAWVGSLHPSHGRRLREAADRIDWDA